MSKTLSLEAQEYKNQDNNIVRLKTSFQSYQVSQDIPAYWNDVFKRTYRQYQVDQGVYDEFAILVKEYEEHKRAGGLVASDVETTYRLAQHAFRNTLNKHGKDRLKVVGKSFYRFNGAFWEELQEEEYLHTLLLKYDRQTYLHLTVSKRDKKFILHHLEYSLKERLYEQKKEFVKSLVDVFRIQRLVDNGFFNKEKLPLGLNAKDYFVKVKPNGDFVLEKHAPEQRQRKVLDFNIKPLIGEIPAFLDNHSSFFASRLGQLLTRVSPENPLDRKIKLNLFAEIFGCALAGLGTKLAQPKAFFLYGKGNSGKSVFIDVLKGFIGTSHVSSVSPKELNGEYNRIKTKDKYLNFSHDISSAPLEGDEFKRLVTGENVTGRDIYKEPESFDPIALHVFAGNVLPSSVKGGTGVDSGIARRMCVVNMDNPISTNHIDHSLREKILKEEQGVLSMFALYGLRSLAKNNWQYTSFKESEEATTAWANEADDVRYFFERLPKDAGSFTKTEDIFLAFKEMQEKLSGKSTKFGYKSFSHRFADIIKQNQKGALKKTQKKIDGKKYNGYTGIAIHMEHLEDKFGKESFKTNIDWFSDLEAEQDEHVEIENTEQEIFSRFATDCCVQEQYSDSEVETGSSMVQFFERWQWWIYNKVPYMEKKTLSEQYNTLNAFQSMAIPYLEAQHKQGHHLQLKEM